MRIGIICWATPLAVVALALGGCGGSSGARSAGSSNSRSALGKSAGAAVTEAGVAACLSQAGFGVLQVPASAIAPNAADNRGPGQTGELDVGADGIKPILDSSDNSNEVAVMAFWSTDADAGKQVRQIVANKLGFAKAYGGVTIQQEQGLRSQAQLTKLEHCAQ